MVTFTHKNKDGILAYFSMIAPCCTLCNGGKHI